MRGSSPLTSLTEHQHKLLTFNWPVWGHLRATFVFVCTVKKNVNCIERKGTPKHKLLACWNSNGVRRSGHQDMSLLKIRSSHVHIIHTGSLCKDELSTRHKNRAHAKREASVIFSVLISHTLEPHTLPGKKWRWGELILLHWIVFLKLELLPGLCSLFSPSPPSGRARRWETLLWTSTLPPSSSSSRLRCQQVVSELAS